jgi:DNA-binding transcriptional LysR family regulator
LWALPTYLTAIEERNMSAFYDPMDVIADLFDPLTRPNHGFTSVSQLCIVTRIPEDFGRRNVAKVEGRFHARLIQVENHRLMLSDRGRRVWKLALQERAEAENGEGPTELLTVECAPCVAEAACVAKALSEFKKDFGDHMRLRICDLEAVSVRQNIAGHITDVAIGLAEDGDARSGIEALQATASAGILFPEGHWLQSGVEPVAGSDLKRDEQVFISADALTLPGVREWLQGVVNRVECDSHALIRRCVVTGLGLGVTLRLDGEDMADGLRSRSLASVDSQRLCFYLPRRATELSELARALLEVLRKHLETPKNESRIATEPATVSTALPVAAGEIGGLPITSLEETKS